MIITKETTSEILASHIVIYRILGINKENATICMEELSNRRNNGDDFNFEDFIQNEIDKVPKPDKNIKKLLTCIPQKFTAS